MSQRDVILSMVEAVSCTLNEANNNEISQAEQFDIVLRAIPFFNEILSMVNSTTAHQLPELRTAVDNFLKGCNRCMIFISKEAPLDTMGLLIDFLDTLISSCLVAECIDSMSLLLVGILNTRDIPKERATKFTKIFKTFFLASDLRSEFIKGDGILTSWFTYVAEPENPLILEVFNLFEVYLEFFALPDFSSHITDLIAAVSASFSSLSMNSAKFIFPIIEKIVAFNPKFYIQKLDENLFFQSIYLFIIQHQDDDPNLISYLEFFTTLVPFSSMSRKPSNETNQSLVKIPSLDMIINVISSMECKIPLRHRALKGIEGILRYVNAENMPFSTDQISLIANAIPIDDSESVYIFSTICLDLNIQANFDISPLIPFLQRFMTIDLLLTIDMTKYISLFLEYQREVSPFMPALYISIFKKLTPELFSDLVNRYGHLFAFISQHFGEPLSKEQLDEFMKLLVISFPYYHDVGGAESCLTNIISSKKGYLFTNTIFEALEAIASTTYLCDSNGSIIIPKNEDEKKETISPSISSSSFNNQNIKLDKATDGKYDLSGILRSLTKTLRDSFSFRSECINQEVYIRIIDFYSKFGISGSIILDFISALTNHIYIPLLDAAVYHKLKEINFMGMNKQQLLRFALGLQQQQEKSPQNQQLSNPKDESLASPKETEKTEKTDVDSKQLPILSFLTNDEDQGKEIPIDDVIDNVSNQIPDQGLFKPFESNSTQRVTIADLNDGFSDVSNLRDQNPSTSNNSIRKYSSSLTSKNIVFSESISGSLFNFSSSTSLDDNAVTDCNKNQFQQQAVNQAPPFEIMQAANAIKSSSKHHGHKKKKTHHATATTKTAEDADKQISASFPHAALCFPSFLGHCDDYLFTSRYDLWVCGRVGLSAWLRDSGRPINEFPSIVSITSQYARREHLEMLIDYPQIFYKTCENLAKLPPLFEFKKSFDCSFSVTPSSSSSSPFIATPGFYSQNIKSFCLWFQVSENSPEVTNFLTINSNIQLFLLNHDILFEGNPIGSFEIGKWIFFAATSEPQSTTINVYLDLKLIFKIQNKYGFNPTQNNKSIVTFGGKHCKTTWFIGGTIRFFSEPVTTELLTRVYSYGVSSILTVDKLNINANGKVQPFETIRKSPTMSAPLFNDIDIHYQIENNSNEKDATKYIENAIQYANIVNGSYIDRKERPVSIYSLLNYIQNVKGKPYFIIKRTLEFLEKEDYESANYLLKSLCILKKNKIIKQSNEHFALSISVLFHIAPNILTDDTIDLIISCFERTSRINIIKDKSSHNHEDKNVGYDWNSFFVFAFDYSLMFSKHSVVFISKFFELDARYPITDDMSRYSFTLYLFSLLLLPEFDKSLNESILDFILKLRPDSSLIFFLLTSYPNMAVAITDNSKPYSFDDEDNIICLILKSLSNIRIRQFNYYFLLNVLPSSMSSKLIRTLSEQHLHTIFQQQQPQGRLRNNQYDGGANSNAFGGFSVQQNYSIFTMQSEFVSNGNYALESLDFNEIFETLLHNVFMPESWFSAISICTNSLNVDDLHNFSLNHFDMNLFEPFFKMFTLLSCACFRINEDSFWIRFAALLSEQMILIIPSIPEKIVTKTLKFWLLQLMTFGQPFDKMSSFPPYPLAFTSRDVLEYIETREQKYPTNYGKPFTFQPVTFPFASSSASSSSTSANNPKVYNEMLEQVCNFVDFVSPKVFCLNGVSKFHVHHKRHQKVYKEIFDSNVTYVAKDWIEYINNIIKDFGLDRDLIPVKEHPLTDILIRLISTFVVHCPPLFQTIFNTMSIFPNDLMMILVHKITICSLNLCEHQKIFHHQLIDLACKRAMEGWYTAHYVTVIQQIFKIVNQCFLNDSSISSNSQQASSSSSSSSNYQLPISFYNAIIFGFDVIPGNDVPKLINLVSNNRNIFINQSFIMNFDLCLTFIAQMLKYINILTNTFYQLWTYFVSMIKSFDQFQIQWNKTYGPQQSKLIGSQSNSQADAVDFSSFLSFLTMIEKNGAKGFDAWTKMNSKIYVPLEKLLQTTSTNYHHQVLNEIATEIDSLIKLRNEKSLEFIRISNSIIIERSKKVTCCKAKAACLRQLSREYFIFMNLFFIRRRENHVSSMIPIKFNKKSSSDKNSRKAISILSDPIFPTRRLEKSPLGYSIPSFPDGTYRELFPEKTSTLPVFDDINYSSSIRELFSYEAIQVPFLLRYSPFQLHAKFTQFLPIQPYQNLILLSLLINKGSNFQHICNCSLLYGIETLNGCLFICENSMYFGEGFKIDEENKNNGFTFVHQNNYSLPYYFYLQNIMTNHFGRFSLYQGHPIIEWSFDDIIAVYPHIWIHKPYSITLNFIRGFNFVLNFKKVDYDYIFPILKRYSSSFYDSAPPVSSIHTDLSIINSARYLQLSNKEVTSKWQNGEIDTFTYLCILNRFGKRPTCDMTQYPVFPWIISEFKTDVLNLYNNNNSSSENDDVVNKGPSTAHHKNPSFRDLSLPMGQIGKQRSERFNEFYKDTNNQYYYGTHYMHYGVVLYFMFRVDPFTFFSIELNKGWDHPNRVFCNLADSWMSAAFNSQADLKEVIPQFFLVPEIFENTSHLPLTTNDEGNSVASVKLPNWAKNAREMSDILLKLMECDYVQKNINHWIDLIFGDKSRGQSARDVKNLFHPLCYAPVRKHRETGEENDPESLEDDVSREASIISIINFGQCPQQVMNKPHPQIKYSKYWRILSSPIISQAITSSIESLSQKTESANKTENDDLITSTQSGTSSEESNPSQASANNNSNNNNNNNSSGTEPSLMKLSEAVSKAPMSLTSNWQRLRADSFLMPPFVSYCDSTNVVLTSNHKISAFIPPTGQILYVEDNAVMLTSKNLSELYKLSENDIFITTSAVTFSSDGFYLAMALRDGSFLLYKLMYVKGEARYPKLLHVFSAYGDEEAEETEETEEKDRGNLKLKNGTSDESFLSTSYSMENVIDHSEKYRERVHDILSITVSSEHFIAFAASGKRIVQFDIGLYSNMPPINLDFIVRKVEVDDQAALLFAVGDYDIAVITISGEVLIKKKIESSASDNMCITCMATSRLPQYFIGRFFTTGHKNGKLCFWSVSYRDNELQQIGWCKLSDDPIVSVALAPNSQRMIAGTMNEVFSCECQNINGGITLNLVNAIRIASQIQKNTKQPQQQQQQGGDAAPLPATADVDDEDEKSTKKQPPPNVTKQQTLNLHDNDDGFTVIDINKPGAAAGGQQSSSSHDVRTLTAPMIGFESQTSFVPFVSAASGSTGGFITGSIQNIGGGSGGGNSVSCIPLKKETYATECAACHCDIKKNAFVCAKCGRFFCQKCITKEINALKTTITCDQCIPPQYKTDGVAQSNA